MHIWAHENMFHGGGAAVYVAEIPVDFSMAGSADGALCGLTDVFSGSSLINGG